MAFESNLVTWTGLRASVSVAALEEMRKRASAAGDGYRFTDVELILFDPNEFCGRRITRRFTLEEFREMLLESGEVDNQEGR